MSDFNIMSFQPRVPSLSRVHAKDRARVRRMNIAGLVLRVSAESDQSWGVCGQRNSRDHSLSSQPIMVNRASSTDLAVHLCPWESKYTQRQRLAGGSESSWLNADCMDSDANSDPLSAIQLVDL